MGKDQGVALRFQQADRIVLGVPMWNFSVPYKLKQLIDLSCQRNMLFKFDGEFYGPSLSIDRAFVAYVRGQSDEAGSKRSLNLASNISAVTLSFGCSS
jgi:FMN-dependent NADH-azoreductase